ncbi:MAG: K(+)-transporting ATPase subunit F [Gemmatimonadaceae bacterium]
MVIRIVIAIVAILVGILGFAATKPDTFRVERATLIKAPPDKLFALINDFHNWNRWSPWEKLDPAMTRTYGGLPAGKGATYAWEGNSKVGKGHMEITGSAPPSSVTIQLDFLKPFEAHNITLFTLTPTGDSTSVSWAMSGPNLYMGKVMSVFVSMDSMIGRDFETGLANIKAVAEM